MTSVRKTRALIVDDSAFMRKIIGDILEADPQIEVVGKARDGDEAIRKIKELSPDLVTLDVEMPGKNGLEVLREIMEQNPLPVIMVSNLTKRGADVTMQALDAGAVDFVTKPSGSISLDMEKIGDALRRKVRAASRASVSNASMKWEKFISTPHSPAPVDPSKRFRNSQKPFDMLVVAASTGGPMALQEIVPALSEDFPLPVLIVQHMPPGFTSSLARRLNERSKIKVVEACDDMPIRKGVAILAPGGYHLVVERKQADLVCRLTETAPVRSVRPAADVLFQSVAEVVGGNVLVLVLTGMGKDGTDGARALKKKGAYVIAESKETCVIPGMPGAIVEAGLSDEVIPLYAIASNLVRLVK